MEKRTIFATLAHCSGNKRRAAQVLGVSLKTLYNRLNEYASEARAAVPGRVRCPDGASMDPGLARKHLAGTGPVRAASHRRAFRVSWRSCTRPPAAGAPPDFDNWPWAIGEAARRLQRDRRTISGTSRQFRELHLPIRILIADDHAIVRAGLQQFIAEEPDLRSRGRGGNRRAGTVVHPQPAVRCGAARHRHAGPERGRCAGPDQARQARSPGADPHRLPGGAVCSRPAARRRQRVHPQGERSRGADRRAAHGRAGQQVCESSARTTVG